MEKVQGSRAEDRNTFMATLSLGQKNLEETKAILERLSQEKKEVVRELQQVKQELEEERSSNQDLKVELAITKKSFQGVESYTEAVKSLENEKQELIRMLFDAKKELSE